jgi:hypothetical protein
MGSELEHWRVKRRNSSKIVTRKSFKLKKEYRIINLRSLIESKRSSAFY